MITSRCPQCGSLRTATVINRGLSEVTLFSCPCTGQIDPQEAYEACFGLADYSPAPNVAETIREDMDADVCKQCGMAVPPADVATGLCRYCDELRCLQVAVSTEHAKGYTPVITTSMWDDMKSHPVTSIVVVASWIACVVIWVIVFMAAF